MTASTTFGYSTSYRPGVSLTGVLNRAAHWLFGSNRRAMTRAEEAASVREMAQRVQTYDPGFAADLYAAAARHEGLDD
ncbi:MAG: hypothetical protein KGL43_26785 [Burkholderiales bacterium]|nr:hypothetical protein [Burkholderiales bacterium]MDE2394368.1 hypothetical protein [Burkholderiales bacterium]MDE2457213.1 hypothetical protein [Burkholderiales bacterium]